jgi:hypothetical protein
VINFLTFFDRGIEDKIDMRLKSLVMVGVVSNKCGGLKYLSGYILLSSEEE